MTKRPTFVVGLGASAGGLEALERFFDHCPDDTGGAFVVVMHLSRNFKSMLDELLARHTTMKVKAAEDGEPLAADTVYVIQPATILELAGPKFRVRVRPQVDPTGPATNIDTLFRSIAEQWRDRGGAVVLSGSGSDGAQGVIAIRDAGGFAAAQSPETAKFDSMPLSAIATSAVRAVEAPEQLGQTVVEGILLPSLSPSLPARSDHNVALAKILDAVVGASSASAAKYKNSTFERRVQRRMMDLGITSLTDYADRVAADPVEARRLSQTLLIGVTEFFRDAAPFRVVAQQLVPELIRRAQAENRSVRVWVPGCATGEEAYSLAMLFLDALADFPHKIEVQIFATDLKREYLSEAARGEFAEEKYAKVPEEFRRKFFRPADVEGRYVIDPEVRKLIVFAPHDILVDPPFTRLDLISCRNLLIYFSLEAQQRILRNFAFGLLERAFLFLGPSETIGGFRDTFEFVDAKSRIFRRTSTRPRPLIPMAEEGMNVRSPEFATPSRRPTRSRETNLQPAYAALLAEYAPPSLLVSTERTLLHSFGDVRRFVRPPEGVAHLDVADMVDPALKTPLVAGVDRALKDLRPISFSRVRLDTFPEAGAVVNLFIRPLGQDQGDPQHLLIVIDEASKEQEEVINATVVSADELARERISELEHELERTREALQSTIEEIETANEELQSSNEELMSSNEELQSTNEELSSVNEELYSVNAEYHRQNDELSRLNADFDLLLKATEIGVVFLDANLHISRFAGLAAGKFKLSEADVGRPLSTFRSPFVDGEPQELVERALAKGETQEAELRDAYGDAWLLRAVVQPNRLGTVLTVINIERLRSAEAQARQNAAMLASVREVNGAFYFEASADFSRVERELGWFNRVGYASSNVPAPLEWSAVAREHHEELTKALGDAVESFDIVVPLLEAESGQHRFTRLVGHRRPAASNEDILEVGWRVTGIDVDDLKSEEQAAVEQRSILHAMLRASPSMAGFIDRDHRFRAANESFARQWKKGQEDLVGQRLDDVLPLEAVEQIERHVEAALGGERVEFDLQLPNDAGEPRRFAGVLEPVKDKKAQVEGFAFDLLDVTDFYARAELAHRTDRMLSSAAKAAPYLLMLVDQSSGNVEFANRAGLDALGLASERNLSRGIRISRLTAEWGDLAWRRWMASIETDGDDSRYDVPIVDVNKRPIPADLYAHALEDQGRRKIVLFGFVNRERAETMQDLRERTRQLAISNRDLEQFASVVAHDLRAPLRHARFFSKSVRQHLEPSLEGEVKEDFERVEDGLERMSRMIEALLAYARLGRDGAEFELLSVEDVVRHAADVVLSDAKLPYELEVKDHGLDLLGDRSLIDQLFANLLSNSLKYQHPERSLRIEVTAEKNQGDLLITVSDNGIGIQPSFAERIFEVFQRLHTARSFPGLGIGLAACRRIVEIHNGTILLDVEYEQGARFIIRLPSGKKSGPADALSAPPA